MSEFDEKLAQLQTRLEHLEKYETAFKREITDIRRNINLLKSNATLNENDIKQSSYAKPPEIEPLPKKEYVPPKTEYKKSEYEQQTTANIPNLETNKTSISEQARTNLEKFIGENLISKIGIVVLIIGVGIGAKYAIDNNYITPLMRIIFGYFVGFALIGFAIKLKAKYHDYSAVLMSGGMAVMYFITYFAYSYYALLSQISAFSLMVIFTVFTVLASLIYNRQIIAHIGLVGAYAVPLLLSENSGRVAVLFTYIAILNVGILAVSVKKYWKPLFYSSFVITWLIYVGWMINGYNSHIHFSLALVFLSIFFLTFYLTFIASKVIHKEPFKVENILLISLNAFCFYFLGCVLLDFKDGADLIALFTVLNAVIHFAFAFFLYKLKTTDKAAFYLIVSFVITFLTISVPLYFEGDWLTLMWMAEAVFLYVIGRTQKIPLFEYFSYPLMVLASFGLLLIWENAMTFYAVDIKDALYPIFNGNFVTSITMAIGFAVIYFVDRDKRCKTFVEKPFYQIIKYTIPTVMLVILYNTFRIEIGNYFRYLNIVTAFQSDYVKGLDSKLYRNESLELFSAIWQINYTMLFLAALSFLNIKKFKSVALGFANLILNSIVLTIFLTAGLFILSVLTYSYLDPIATQAFEPGIYYILIRYISYLFVAALVFACRKYIKQEFLTNIISAKILQIAFDCGLYFLLLVILSSEVINWSNILGFHDIYKLGLTILFGIYAVFLIVLGIIQKKQHLRIFAIVLFAVTLLKLFFYDIAELGTISKTIVFVSVGILLLITSFLYTKYKNVIFDEDEII
ncbi:MAG: DUF2339 domain-containing protein [Aridibacter sp.]